MRLLRVVTGVGLAAISGVLASRAILRKALPRPGVYRVPGLDGETEILRDEWGIPHIFARTEHDLYFANGVVHAEDRLWQMEVNRRAATGRLSEMFGKMTLEVDRYMRRIGLGRSAVIEANSLDQSTADVLDAYIAGVNWAIESRPRPLEFRLLRHSPEPWTRVDSLAWAKLMAWGLSVNWDTELARAKLIQQVGPEIAAELEPVYPARGSLITGGEAIARADSTILKNFKLVRELTGLGSIGGSNAWAVAPSRSANGHALLANDMHLAPSMPSVWYELSLDATNASGEGLKVAGTTLPGLPGVIAGHNDRIAWGVTASLADVQDLFVERVHPENPHRFARGDGWEDAEIVREEIRIKGVREWHVENVVITSNGPVISDGLSGTASPLSLRASPIDPSQTLRAGIRLNKARDWDEFRATLSEWATPSLNFVFADVEGNIGFQMVGSIPKRAVGDGSVPVPGWDPSFAWQGYLSIDELPHVFNPVDGFVATSNNRPVNDDYPWPLGTDWCDTYRIDRVVEMIRDRPLHDRASMSAIQLDVHSNAARDFIVEARRIVGDTQPLDPIERESLRMVLGWDGEMSPHSSAASIYAFAREAILRFLYGPELGEMVDLYLGGRAHQMAGLTSFAWRSGSMLIHAMRDPEWPSKRGHGDLTWREVFLIGFGEGVANLRVKHGEDIGQWRWGRIRSLEFGHHLGRSKPLSRLFNRSTSGMGGDTDTPCQVGIRPGAIDGSPGWIPSYRQVIDLGDFRGAVSMHTTGQSGQPFSKHYDDLIPLWAKGFYHPLLWDRRDIESHLVSETRLISTDELFPRP